MYRLRKESSMKNLVIFMLIIVCFVFYHRYRAELKSKDRFLDQCIELREENQELQRQVDGYRELMERLDIGG